MSMEIVEEIRRQRSTFAVENPGSVYAEIRDLLERRMSFDKVTEEKYFHDVEEGRVRSHIVTIEFFDNVTREELEIYLTIDETSNELDILVKGKLVTEYDVDGWRDSVWYYAYRALYDKFLYGSVRHGYEPAVEEKIEELIERIRQNVEAT